MEQDAVLVRKLLVEFNIFIQKRYGKVSKLIFSILLLRFLLLYSSRRILFYLDKIDLDEKKKLPVNEISHNNDDSRIKNLKVKIRKILSFRGGGSGISKREILKVVKWIREGVTFFEINASILSIFPFLTQLIRVEDLSVSVYDLYLSTPTLKGAPTNICSDENLGFSYLLLIFDGPADSISFEQKKEQIYNVLFEKGKLSSSNGKEEFFIRIFITCAIIFLLHFRDKGGSGPTIFAFFEALIEAL